MTHLFIFTPLSGHNLKKIWSRDEKHFTSNNCYRQYYCRYIRQVYFANSLIGCRFLDRAYSKRGVINVWQPGDLRA